MTKSQAIPLAHTPSVAPVLPETNLYRKASVQSGKQPSYGKRTQLIPDGLSSPEAHLAAAKLLAHPFDSLEAHKVDHAESVRQLTTNPTELIARRFESLDRLIQWERELRSQQAIANQSASWTARKLGLKPKTVLMERLQESLNIEDGAVPQACLHGLNITGTASESPFFDSFPVPPSMSGEEFHAGKYQRSLDMMERVKFMAEKSPPELSKAIWDKTMKEVKAGTMGPPMSFDEVVKLYGDDFQVPMAMVDYVGVMLRALAASCGTIQLATEDMKGAYRQIPLAPGDVRYAITAVYSPDTREAPSEVCAVLGVLFSTAALAVERRIHIAAKPARVQNLIQTIDHILDTGELTPAAAASIVGKFGFLCSTLFGKVGRCCTAAIRHRQYSSPFQRLLTPAIHLSLQLMKQFLTHCPSRELKLQHESPILMYTDASDVPGRTPQRLLGAVLYDPLDSSLSFTAWPVSPALVSRWLPKSSFMGQLELLAAPFAFSTWQDRIRNRSILLFIDNDAAGASLVRGYSPKQDSGEIVGQFWLLAAELKTHVYIDRVESKSNIADGPSRNQFDEVLSLGGSWTSPKTGTALLKMAEADRSVCKPLAAEALKRANEAVGLDPTNVKAYARCAAACDLLEEHEAAAEFRQHQARCQAAAEATQQARRAEAEQRRQQQEEQRKKMAAAMEEKARCDALLERERELERRRAKEDAGDLGQAEAMRLSSMLGMDSTLAGMSTRGVGGN
eukprot:s164_g43.t1